MSLQDDIAAAQRYFREHRRRPRVLVAGEDALRALHAQTLGPGAPYRQPERVWGMDVVFDPDHPMAFHVEEDWR